MKVALRLVLFTTLCAMMVAVVAGCRSPAAKAAKHTAKKVSPVSKTPVGKTVDRKDDGLRKR